MRGERVDQQRAGQPDDVEVVAVDPRDEAGTEALDRVAAGAPVPLAVCDVGVDLRLGEPAERDVGDGVLDDGEAGAEQAEARDDEVGAAGELARASPARSSPSAGLP